MANFPKNKIGKVLWRLPNITYGFLDVEVEGLDSVEAVCKFNKQIKNGFAPDDELPEIEIPKELKKGGE